MMQPLEPEEAAAQNAQLKPGTWLSHGSRQHPSHSCTAYSFRWDYFHDVGASRRPNSQPTSYSRMSDFLDRSSAGGAEGTIPNPPVIQECRTSSARIIQLRPLAAQVSPKFPTRQLFKEWRFFVSVLAFCGTADCAPGPSGGTDVSTYSNVAVACQISSRSLLGARSHPHCSWTSCRVHRVPRT